MMEPIHPHPYLVPFSKRCFFGWPEMTSLNSVGLLSLNKSDIENHFPFLSNFDFLTFAHLSRGTVSALRKLIHYLVTYWNSIFKSVIDLLAFHRALFYETCFIVWLNSRIHSEVEFIVWLTFQRFLFYDTCFIVWLNSLILLPFCVLFHTYSF